ncbi:hypothetical protein [Pontibacter sp. G13]|uniref:hypothetical protein n=1 Tax=Pontibacter sp. G13 TaxID=3074898 RepID=UPI00288BFC40|nr:hypothetical protein [Pontibacter sp. G13]WNJ17540.1 hypothetical protein RJD25_22045 [Pontibacter sp. G13]
MPHSPAFYEEEVRQILGLPPNRLMWYGNYLLALVITILLVLAATIPIPRSFQVPAEILGQQVGNFQQISLADSGATWVVRDRQEVAIGDTLGQILREGKYTPFISSTAGTFVLMGDGPFQEAAIMPHMPSTTLKVVIPAHIWAFLSVGSQIQITSADSDPIGAKVLNLHVSETGNRMQAELLVETQFVPAFKHPMLRIRRTPQTLIQYLLRTES